EFYRRGSVRPAQAESGGADRLAAKLHALEFAGDHRQRDGGGLPDAESGPAARGLGALRHIGAGKAEVDRVRRRVGPDLARRASALVLRRRIRAPECWRGRLQADAKERRSVLWHLPRAKL